MGQMQRLDAQDGKERGCRDGADGSPGREARWQSLQFSDREISSGATGTA